MKMLERLIAKFVYRTAANAVAKASNWAVYQPKEPERLRNMSTK